MTRRTRRERLLKELQVDLQNLNLTNVEFKNKIEEFEVKNTELQKSNIITIVVFAPLLLGLIIALIFVYKSLRKTQDSLISSLKSSGVIPSSICETEVDVAKELTEPSVANVTQEKKSDIMDEEQKPLEEKQEIE